MFIFFILGLLLGGAAVVFVLQNVAIITVTFFTSQLTGSLAIILILAILAGALIALLMVLPGSIEHALRARNLEKEIKKLEEDLRKQKELTVFAKKTPPTAEDIARIENGAIEDSGQTF